MRSNAASNDPHAALIFVAVARSRAVELACAVSVFFSLGYAIAEAM